MGDMGIVGKRLRIIPTSQPQKDVKRVKKNHRILSSKTANNSQIHFELKDRAIVAKEVVVSLY